MVHAFKRLGSYFLLDSDSGSVFSVDYPVYLLVRQSLGKSDSGYSLSDSELFDMQSLSSETFSEADAEIRQLINDGVLFTDIRDDSARSDGKVKALCINISHDCNLSCRYCFAAEGTYSGERANMTAETAKASVDFLVSHSSRRVLEIDFFGGEPLLNLDVVKQCVDYALSTYPDKIFRFTLTTNALLLDKKTAEYLNDFMDNVVISIDGRKDVHNSVRPTRGGKASADVSIENAKYFRKIRKNADYYIRGTYTADNIDFAEDVIAIRDYGFDSISIEPVVLPAGHALALTEEHLPSLSSEYERLAKIYLESYGTDRAFNFFHFRLDLSGGPCAKKRLTGCGSGYEYFCVTPDGSLYPCHQFAGNDKYKCGNVHDGITDTDIVDTFSGVSIYSKQKCRNCWAKYYCSGGCSANAVNLSGDINTPLDIMCEITKMRLECAVAVNVHHTLANAQKDEKGVFFHSSVHFN